MWGDGSRRDTDQLPNPPGSSPTPARGGLEQHPLPPTPPASPQASAGEHPQGRGVIRWASRPNSLILQLQPSHCEYLKPPSPCMGPDFGG